MEETRNISSFSNIGLPAALTAYLKQKGIVSPTEIQSASYDLIASGRSFLGMSETGSGKTYSYLLPLAVRFNPLTMSGLFGIILVPSSELVHQTIREIKDLSQAGPRYEYSAVALLTERSRNRQLEELRKKHPNFIVGTPGVIRKYIDDRKLHVQNAALKREFPEMTQILVLDEADELSSHSFRDDCIYIASKFLKDTQILGFSATLNRRAESLFDAIVRHPYTEFRDASIHIPGTVRNLVVYTTLRMRFETARQIINTFKKDDRILIFTSNVYEIRQIYMKLNHRGYRVSYIDGQADKAEIRNQKKRFDDGQTSIMITTDALGRGMNLGSIAAVIQYRLPEDIRTYVNRAGRTGRNGQHGTNIAICEAGEKEKIGQYAHRLNVSINEVRPDGGKLISTE
ncbi:MAG: DEAD/DEAH box helicase [Lachnospiraceae bacterium]|jgi:superfamily II DNA/RNA helicase